MSCSLYAFVNASVEGERQPGTIGATLQLGVLDGKVRDLGILWDPEKPSFLAVGLVWQPPDFSQTTLSAVLPYVDKGN